MALNSQRLSGKSIRDTFSAIRAATQSQIRQTRGEAPHKEPAEPMPAEKAKSVEQEKPAEKSLVEESVAEEMPAEGIPTEEMASGEMLAEPVQVAGKTEIETERRVEMVTDKEIDSGCPSGCLTGEHGAPPLEKERPESVQSESETETTGRVVEKQRSGRRRLLCAVAALLVVLTLGIGYAVRARFFPGVSPSPDKSASPLVLEGHGPEEQGPKENSETTESGPGIVSEPDQQEQENREMSYVIDFSPDSSLIRPPERERVRSVAKVIDRDPPDQIAITGHTARFGTEESCLILSRLRAEAVRELLLAHSSFDENKITARGVSASQPLEEGLTQIPFAKNRRAEIRLAYQRATTKGR